MSFLKPSPQVIQELKIKYGSVLLVEFGELGWFVLVCWTREQYGEFVDAAAKDRPNATQRFAARAVVYPAPAEYAIARQRKPALPSTIVGVLCEAAGIPRGEGSQADTWEEKLNDATPPASLERAGLSREQADKLLAGVDRELTLVSVSDRAGKVFFGGVLAEPTDVESGMVRDLKKLRKGLQTGMKSIVESCLVWSRDPLDPTIDTHPAIVTILMETIADRLEVFDTGLFRP